MNPTDKIVLFNPERAAELIGNPDALVLLKACWQQAAQSAFGWVMTGDITKPWCYVDPAARGQVLVDAQSEKLCDALLGAGEAQAMTYRRMVSMTGFEGRQFHREEIARWLDAMGIDSDYAFRLAEDDSEVAAPDEDCGENGGTKRRWTKERAWEAWGMLKKHEAEGVDAPMQKVAGHYGVSGRRMRQVLQDHGLR